MSREYDEAEMRKMQENIAKMIRGGYHKEIAKTHKAMYDAYIEVGFSPWQAMILVLNLFKLEK